MTERRTPYRARGYQALTRDQRPRVLVGSGYFYELWPERVVRARFTHEPPIDHGDGRVGPPEVIAAPQDTRSYRAQAVSRGYRGADVAWQQCRAHDLCHLVLSQELSRGERQSPVLLALAEGDVGRVPPWLQYGEEALVAALERFVNGRPPSPLLACLVLAGVDLFLLRDTIRRALGGAAHGEDRT